MAQTLTTIIPMNEQQKSRHQPLHERAAHLVRRVSFSLEEKAETDGNAFPFEKHVQWPDTSCTGPLHQVVADASESIVAHLKTPEDYRALWYQRDELVEQKKNVRSLILQETTEEEASMLLVGLGRFTVERSQHKHNAIFHILSAQERARFEQVQALLEGRKMSRTLPAAAESWIAKISRYCTAWARHVAAEEGFATFCDVYGDPILDSQENEEDIDASWDLFQQEFATELLVDNGDNASGSDNKANTVDRATTVNTAYNVNQEHKKRKDINNAASCGDHERNVRPRLDIPPLPSPEGLSIRVVST